MQYGKLHKFSRRFLLILYKNLICGPRRKCAGRAKENESGIVLTHERGFVWPFRAFGAARISNPYGGAALLAAPHEVVIPAGEEVDIVAEAVCQMIGGFPEEVIAVFHHVVDKLDAQIVISHFFDLLFLYLL